MEEFSDIRYSSVTQASTAYLQHLMVTKRYRLELDRLLKRRK